VESIAIDVVRDGGIRLDELKRAVDAAIHWCAEAGGPIPAARPARDGGTPTAENLDAALELQSFGGEQQAHEKLRIAIKDAANALELIAPSDPPLYSAPPAFRSLLREPWTLALLTMRHWDDDPTPPMPEETDLPDRASTKEALESLWSWSKRTLDRLR
jgi:hypothetical protein